jgi:hypothetical protein
VDGETAADGQLASRRVCGHHRLTPPGICIHLPSVLVIVGGTITALLCSL